MHKSDPILVTGSAGLLGRELCSQLVGRGYRVRGVDIAEQPRCELLDPDHCRDACAGVTTIVHAAARQHHSSPPRWRREDFFSANRTMTARVVAAGIAAGVRHIVLVSSDMVYGLPPKRPLRESDPPLPIGPYGRSKLASELVCQAAREHGLTVTILRPRLIVGPGRLGVLTRLFDRIRAGKSVPMLGDGGNRYQMVGVADVAAACIAAIERRIDGTFNLGSSDPPTVRSLLAELCRRADTGSRVSRLPLLPAHAALWALHAVRLSPLVPEQFRIAAVDYVLDTGAAQRDLGWTPKLDDVEMLWQAYQTYARPVVRARSAAENAIAPMQARVGPVTEPVE